MEFKFNEEFDESDVMFSDYSSDQSLESNESENGDRRRMALKRRKSLNKKPRIRSSSVPVNIPTGFNSLRYDEYNVDSVELFEEFNDEGDIITRMPPHLIVERRANEEIARSFSPIKGKNLCQVRNSILRMTGFLER